MIIVYSCALQFDTLKECIIVVMNYLFIASYSCRRR